MAARARPWDEIGAIFILLLAAASLRDWVEQTHLAHSVLRGLWWLAYLGAAARLFQRFGVEWLRWTFRQQPALCLLLALALASGFWSLAPAFSLQKATSLVGTTMLGVFIGYGLPPQRLMRVLYWAFLVLIVSSLVIVLSLNEPFVAGQPLGWRGIMAHKNSLGSAAVLASTFFLIVTLARRGDPRWGATLCGLSVLVAAGSRSRTPLLALGLSALAAAYLVIAHPTWRPTRERWQWAWVALLFAISVTPLFLGPLAAALGNDDPVNGRTRLWAGSLAILEERPWTGYGYAAVWGRGDATLLPHVEITAQRSASHAHNGVVNVATELGIPAAVVACVYLFAALSNATRLVERAPSAFSCFALVCLLQMVVLCFTEAHLLQVHSFFWILIVALTVAVRRTEP